MGKAEKAKPLWGHLFNKIMRKIFCSIFITLLFSGLTGFGQVKPENVMLVLGSANPETLAKRVNVAYKLYQIQKFDKIIVSGGCGAHASSICEATAMKNQLIEKGVPEQLIYKEGNSKTTVQNYIFSRILKDENGQQIIQKNDSLYVVSDHWHAIAVASRFKKYDGVNAKFFIEGDLDPKPTDLLDYGGIFNKEVDNNLFILKGIWPTPDAVFTESGATHYIFADRVYSLTDKSSETIVTQLGQFKPALPPHWKTVDAIAKDDKKGLLLMFNNLEYQVSSNGKSKDIKLLPLNQLVIDLPVDLKNIDASFVKDNDLYLFTGNKVIIAKRKGNKFMVSEIKQIKEFASNWPYEWANGDLTAANYDAINKVINLYKNREVLTVNPKKNSETSPRKLKIKWQDIKN